MKPNEIVEKFEERMELYTDVLSTCGYSHQVNIMIGELLELMTTISHVEIGRHTVHSDKVYGEIADVIITTEEVMYGAYVELYGKPKFASSVEPGLAGLHRFISDMEVLTSLDKPATHQSIIHKYAITLLSTDELLNMVSAPISLFNGGGSTADSLLANQSIAIANHVAELLFLVKGYLGEGFHPEKLMNEFTYKAVRLRLRLERGTIKTKITSKELN